MSPPLVSDDLWEAIEPLLPKEPPKPKGGRPRVPDRAALGGIIFVLRTGMPWRLLPQGLGCGSGSTCWRRLRDWQAAGVWERLHAALLNWLGDSGVIDWSRASLDSLSVRALRARGIAPRITRRGRESSERLGRYRWIVERSLAWLLGYRRLGIRYERRSDLLLGFLHLACALVCLRSLPTWPSVPESPPGVTGRT
jgi:transposase